MNDKIKELAAIAKLYSANSLPSNWDEGDYIISPEELEKFAELIVKECCSIMGEYGHRPAGVVKRNVKEQFGVKE